MRIGFLYNHDTTHQVPHTVPIADALAKRGIDVTALCSTRAQSNVARMLLPADSMVRFELLDAGRLADAADTILKHVAPFRRLAILRRNVRRLAEFDALVVPEITSTRLRTHLGMLSTKLIYVPHGAGDGAAGFLPATRLFDLVLLSGEKVRNRMLAAGLIRPEHSEIVGYPKFDLMAAPKPSPWFDDDKPVVLFNPHFNPMLSSWYPYGPEILRWFARQSDYNLVFAPHVMLFRRRIHTSLIHRRMALRPEIPAEAIRRSGIILDPGSDRSIDMSYTRSADIYLGDVSSQIYEWVRRPRPAIFLDTHAPGPDRRADYGHWSLGDVIESPADLPAALARAVACPDRYRDLQERAVADTFSITDRPAGERAADAIQRLLQGGR